MIKTNNKKAAKTLVLTVTNDLVTDNRVHKVATTLTDMGFAVTLAGRRLKNSLPLTDRNYAARRFKLWFNKGPMFYAAYNIRLFFYLLVKKFDVVVANDLDSLPAAFLATKLTRKALVYDSHEYFTEVPELVNRPKVKRAWEMIEKAILPRLTKAYTVCQSIADVYFQKYGTRFEVLRNLPETTGFPELENGFVPPFPTNLPVIIYQGAVNLGRGVEEAILAMHQVSGARLVVVGYGDKFDACKALIESENLTDKVIMTGKIPFGELRKITRFATIGLSVEKNIGLNYYFALPNKLFDYIHSLVPVLVTRLPEMERIVATHEVGVIIEKTDQQLIANALNQMLANTDKLKIWKENCSKARKQLNWENEKQVLYGIFTDLL
ncbi:MAG TPA: glycosyltransferase [Prolixibacteraceae bacterium]|nr:glycosyltransferase [Prolixibacteraceae bacterium]